MLKFNIPASIVILILFLLSGCSNNTPVTQDFLLMDTLVHIEIRGNLDKNSKATAANAAYERMRESEKRFTYFRGESELARINRLRAGERFPVSEEMFEVLLESRKISRLTGGAFDVTVAPVLEVWSSLKKSRKLPTTEEIRTALELVGSDNWALDEKTKTLSLRKDGVKINLGAVAKGFIVDDGIRVLKEKGIKNALINAGGDMYCMGKGSKGGWRIGIRDPGRTEGVIGIFRISNKAVATSGGYERFVEFNGKKFAHIIDPRTGYPIENLLKSVTVVSDNCITADALATALYILGAREGLSLIESTDGTECFIIDKDGQVYTSSGFRKFDLRIMERDSGRLRPAR